MQQPPQQRRRQSRDRTFAVLRALLDLGPGPHKFRNIADLSDLSVSEVHRRLLQLVDAQLCRRPRHGHYELHALNPDLASACGLTVSGATPPRGMLALLDQLHRRTQQVVLLHTYSPLTGERLCVGAAGTSTGRFRKELALTPQAIDTLRQAPLDADAPGLAMLAHLTRHDALAREDLRRIRQTQLARTEAPLPGWALLSAPVRRLPAAASSTAVPRVVAAVSILAPDTSHGSHLTAYGKLLRSAALRAASTPPLALPHPGVTAVQAA